LSSLRKAFRVNPERAIYVSGEINQELVARLTPIIHDLRIKSNDPITAYIDSPGGVPYNASLIRNLVIAPDQDGITCRLVTVVTGLAASAAADFLTTGNYAIAYPNAILLYHGTRRPADSALTYELASSMADTLRQSNEFAAIQIARSAFERFILRASQLTPQFHEFVNQPAAASPHLDSLVSALTGKLAPTNGKLATEALQRLKVIESLTAAVNQRMRKTGKRTLSATESEARIFFAILTAKVKAHAGDPWLLSDSGLAEVTNDFKLLYDFYGGSQTKESSRYVDLYGKLFLSQAESAELAGIPENDSKAWIANKASDKIQHLWYLMVSICRLLQTTDYILGSEEGYWLGLLDEVLGSDLPCLRVAAEAGEAAIATPTPAPGQGANQS
jgi:ATP-dependent protease ClpP protease subunit